MKKLTLLLTIVSLAFVSGQAQTLDEVLAKHFEASGQKNLSAAKTIRISGKVVQMGMELPMVMKIKRPKKFRMEAEMQGQKMITAFDGENGWMIAPWISPDPQDLAGEQLKQAKEQADIDGDLYHYAEKGHTAKLLGKEDMEGTEVYKIQLNKKNGDTQYYYIDADSYILLKVTTKTQRQGNELEVENIFGNYKMINGVAMPMSIETKVMGQSSQIVFDSVQFNIDLPDSLFTKPEK
ncbi:MAG: outer membrane lipoprotein-sorting protein [Chlorobi bacterium]|nr:outer membrane lipoprotein-sorting protein [Chlorobiota bacterium]